MNTGKRSSSYVDYNDDGVKRVQHSVNYGEIYTNFIKSFDGIVSLMKSSSKEFLKKVYVDVETSSWNEAGAPMRLKKSLLLI